MPRNHKGSVLVILLIIICILLIISGIYLIYRSDKLPFLQLKDAKQKSQVQIDDTQFAHIQDQNLKKHFISQANIKAYRVRSTSIAGKAPEVLIETQFEPNYVKTRTQEIKDGSEISHTIIIKDTIFVKDYSDNKWWKQKAQNTQSQNQEEGGQTIQDEKVFQKLLIESTKNRVYDQVGVDICDGSDCYKYQEIENGKVARTFWFDDETFLLIKEELGEGEFLSHLTYSYNDINIEEPSPTKDVEEGKNIFDTTSPQDEESELKDTGDDIDAIEDEQIPDLPE